ncbi:MAG: translation elongation factor Ts, partial [Candidatus Deferrimicrobium sp.]
MQITSGMVKELREKTGAGLMDCKAALTASDGDMEAAIDHLRKKGLAAASKKSSRIASEGVVCAHVEGNSGALVEVNCETDFVARTDDFVGLAKGVAALVNAKAPRDVDEALTLPAGG